MRPCYIFLAACLTATSAGAASYTITELGSLVGPSGFTNATALNDRGQVTGYSSTATVSRAFLWEQGAGMSEIGIGPRGKSVFGDHRSDGFGINNLGQVAGHADFDDGLRAFVWDRVSGVRFIGDLPGGGAHSSASAINDRGQVAGVGQAAGGARAFVWDEAGGMRDLGDLPGGGDYSGAIAINHRGQVTGYSGVGDDDFGESGEHAFLWDLATGMIDLGDLPGGEDASQPFALNGAGQVVGVGAARDGGRAFLWDETDGMRSLGVLPGTSDSLALGINDAGEVVGVSRDAFDDFAADPRAFLWRDAIGMVDLAALIDPALGWKITWAADINEAGQILGTGRRADGATRAILLTPVPIAQTPLAPALPVMAAALVCLGLVRRRRAR